MFHLCGVFKKTTTMKLKLFITLTAMTALFISCSNDKKPTELAKQVSSIKSDILIENTKYKSGIDIADEETFIMVTGKSLLNGTVVIKTINAKGEELKCETFPAKNLLKDDYKSANSVLKEVKLREVILDYCNS